VFFLSGSLAFGAFSGLLQAIALPVCLQDVHLVGKAVQESPGQSFGAEDLGPLFEGQVRGDDQAGSFVGAANHIDEKLSPGLGEGNVAEFVEDEQLSRCPTYGG